MLNLISGLITLVLLCMFYWTTLKNQRLFSKSLRVVQNDICKLYVLMDLVAETQPFPAKLLYNQIRDIDPNKTLPNKKDILIKFRDRILKSFIEKRESIWKALKDFEDPIEGIQQKKTLLEIETVITLLSSLDKNTSDQYIEDVLKNMVGSLDKIVGIQNGDY